MHYRPSDNAL